GPGWGSDRAVPPALVVREPGLLAALSHALTAPEHLLEHRAVELPRPMFVGIRQRRAGGRGDAQVLELPLAAAQSPADLPQRMGAPELTEQHGHELAPAGEAARMALGQRPLHQDLELRPRKQLEQLAEHAGESANGWASLVWGLRRLPAS